MPTQSKTLLPIIQRTNLPYPDLEANSLVESYPGISDLFMSAGLDPINPFREWIRPGMKVLVKPNWVRHAAAEWSDIDALVTHPSIIRAAVEAVAAALRTQSGQVEGQIVIADAPLQSGNFDQLMNQCGMRELLSYWRSLGWPVLLRDLRRIIAAADDSTGLVQSLIQANGDPAGDTVVDLGCRSRLEEISGFKGGFGVSDYDNAETNLHHSPGRHRYRIANSLLEADVVINLPKWKTHVKTGVTGAMKNFIGVNCDKAYLPHFRPGGPDRGGDEYPSSLAGFHLTHIRRRLEKWMPASLLRTFRRMVLRSGGNKSASFVFSGSWPGNDTLWRTVHDIVLIARWVGPHGIWRQEPRPILTILDGVVAGEGDGPLRPRPRQMGCLIFGLDPGLIDIFAAALSGFNWRNIPMLSHLADAEAGELTSFGPDIALPSVACSLAPPTTWRIQLQSNRVSHAA